MIKLSVKKTDKTGFFRYDRRFSAADFVFNI